MSRAIGSGVGTGGSPGIILRAIGSGVGTGGSPEVVWIEGPEPAHGASALMSLTCDIPFNVCCLSLNELNKLVTSLSDHLFFPFFQSRFAHITTGW